MTSFTGIIPPLVTPLKSFDKLDIDAVDRVIDHVIDGGVRGIFVLGTTGEGPSLTYPMRYEMVERACTVAEGRVPVLVGVTDCSLAESMYLAEHAASCVAAAIVAAAPFYFATTQAAVIDWFERLADESALPLMLYNMPSCVEIHLTPETIQRLSQHPNIVGVKDSSGDLAYFRTLCRQFEDRDDFVVFMGPEELVPQAVAAGADGAVCGGANLLPALYVDLFELSQRGDHDDVTRLMNIVHHVFSDVYRDPGDRMNLIPALKFALHLRGICGAEFAPPLPRLSQGHERQIRERLPALLAMANVPATVRAT